MLLLSHVEFHIQWMLRISSERNVWANLSPYKLTTQTLEGSYQCYQTEHKPKCWLVDFEALYNSLNTLVLPTGTNVVAERTLMYCVTVCSLIICNMVIYSNMALNSITHTTFLATNPKKMYFNSQLNCSYKCLQVLEDQEDR